MTAETFEQAVKNNSSTMVLSFFYSIMPRAEQLKLEEKSYANEALSLVLAKLVALKNS